MFSTMKKLFPKMVLKLDAGTGMLEAMKEFPYLFSILVYWIRYCLFIFMEFIKNTQNDMKWECLENELIDV